MSQAALLQAIWGQSQMAVDGLRALPGQQLADGFSAYREHAKALSVRALGETFLRLRHWLGDDDFRGLAWAFARAHPPEVGDAAQWGEPMPAFLRTLPGMEAAPPELASLDWALHRVADLPDPPEPDPGLWERLQTHPADQLQLRLSPDLSLLHLPALAAADAWACATAGGAPEVAEPGSHIAVWRQQWKPVWLAVTRDLAGLMLALRQHEHLAASVAAAQAEHPELDLAAALGSAWQWGWLLGVDVHGAA